MARIKSNLALIANEADEAVSVALHDTANFILTLTRAFAPVKTGWLRDSYKKHNLAQLHILIGSMVSYSIWQEYGTRKMTGKPHLTPAFMQAENYFWSQLAARVKNLG